MVFVRHLVGAASRQSVPHSSLWMPPQQVSPCLRSGTLAGKVEDAVCSVYGSSGTERVKSLRALSDGVNLDRTIDESHELMKQQANSFVDGLTAKPWWQDDLAKYKWSKQLEKNWRRGQGVWEFLRDEAALTLLATMWGGRESIKEYGTGWKTLPLCDEMYGRDEQRTVSEDLRAPHQI